MKQAYNELKEFQSTKHEKDEIRKNKSVGKIK